MYTVFFPNQKCEIQVNGGTIADACTKAGFSINLVCGGAGTCGKCSVTIEKDQTREVVLACRTDVTSDISVFLNEIDYNFNGVILTDSEDFIKTSFNPCVSKKYYSNDMLTPEYCSGHIKGIGHSLLKKYSTLVHKSQNGITFVLHDDDIIDFQEGNTENTLYGCAIDIGTTSVVVYAFDLLNGRLLCTESALNEQITHGADVITRILYAQESEESLNDLTQKISGTINDILSLIENRIPTFKEHLYNIIICGNSTMQHLFLGLNPKGLGVSPFASITLQKVQTRAQHCMLNAPDNAIVEFLPLLGGFVGADTTSVLLTIPEDDRKYLIIDLGTNGEIAVGNQNHFVTASTACGPALEGGCIEFGMRGTDGAIERVIIEDDQVQIHVIGDTIPKGICGSGIIDAVSELLRTGIIDQSGYLIPRDEQNRLPENSGLRKRIVCLPDETWAFLLSDDEHPIYITQKDIRQVQLAKSSIYSGCLTLLEHYGLPLEKVDTLILSGAFGNYIDIDHALHIGLLPPLDRSKIQSIGNGAGRGVQLCLTNKNNLKKAEEIALASEHVELAESPKFMEEYILNMNFSEG